MDETAKAPLAADPPASQTHVYGVSTANKATFLIAGMFSFCLSGWFWLTLLVPHLRARRAPNGESITISILVALFFSSLGVVNIRSMRARLILTSSQLIVTGLVTHTIPFAQITGVRGPGGRGFYLYRRGKSRVWVREQWFQLDDFYSSWRASIYDLDKADRLKRKTAGKPRMLDWFAVDDNEQHPAIGGPDAPASR